MVDHKLPERCHILGANAPDLGKLHLISYGWVVLISHYVSLYPIITVPIMASLMPIWAQINL